MDMNWHERFKAMKKELGMTNSDIAEITGNSADSVKSVTQPKNEIDLTLDFFAEVDKKIEENKKLSEKIESSQEERESLEALFNELIK